MSLKPSEIAKLSYKEFSKPFEIEGHLIVSDNLTHIIDIEAYESKKPHFGILVKYDLLNDLLKKDIPQAVGTRVDFSGKIRLKAAVTFTGYSILPASIEYIYNYSFENDHCKYNFYISDTFKDVLLIAPENISASMLPRLKSLNEKFRSMTVIDLKKYLIDNHEIPVAEHLEGKSLENLIQVLDELEIQYKISECPIKFGVP